MSSISEISIPGFLLLEENRQYRIEEAVGKGGTGTIFKGVLLDPDLISQHQTEVVAVKRVNGFIFNSFVSVSFLSVQT